MAKHNLGGSMKAAMISSRRFAASHRLISASAAAAVTFTMVFSAVTYGDAPPAQAAATGWLSGSSGNAADNSFGTWRGSKQTLGATWNDTAGATEAQWSVGAEFGAWTEALDVGAGGFRSGSTWAQAANGDLDSLWRTSMQNIYKGWGQKKVIFIRPFHEYNSGYPWKVSSQADADNFKKAWVRYYNIVKTELKDKGKDARLELCSNSDTIAGYGVGAVWPGDQYVDVVGVDYYDGYPVMDNAKWAEKKANGYKNGNKNDPQFPYAWLEFAKSHGKPVIFPEWGVRGSMSDNAAYIKLMHDFFAENAGTGPGQVIGEAYYNISASANSRINPADNPKASAMYKSLQWGGTNASIGSPTTGGATPVPSTPVPATPMPGTGARKGDINGDGKVNITDLSILLASWAP